MTFLGEAAWEPFEQGVEILLGYEGSPTWNKTLQQVQWDLREDFEEGVDPDLTSYVLVYGAVFDWKGVSVSGEEIEFSEQTAISVFQEVDWLRRAVWNRVKKLGREVQDSKNEDAENIYEYVRWHLNYDDMHTNQLYITIKRGELKGYRIIDLKPELTSLQEEIYRAYTILSQTRESGASAPTRIKLSDIIDYVEHGLTSVPKDVLVSSVLAADNAFQEWWHQNHQNSE